MAAIRRIPEPVADGVAVADALAVGLVDGVEDVVAEAVGDSVPAERGWQLPWAWTTSAVSP